MGWFFADRKRRPGGDAWLLAKMSLFVIGGAIAVLGIGLEREWLINVAIAVLLAGFLLRFLPRREHPPEEPPDG